MVESGSSRFWYSDSDKELWSGMNPSTPVPPLLGHCMRWLLADTIDQFTTSFWFLNVFDWRSISLTLQNNERSYVYPRFESLLVLYKMSTNLNNQDIIDQAKKKKGYHTSDVLPVDGASDIDAKDQPDGYFLRPFFLGTLLASGLSVSGVHRPSSHLAETN